MNISGFSRAQIEASLRAGWRWSCAALALVALLGASLEAQDQYATPPAVRVAAPSVSGSSGPAPGQQSPFLGSVPTGEPTPGVLPLSMKDALDRGLRCNLGILLGEEQTRAARGARWQALSGLLPNVTAQTSETIQQLDLAALGFGSFGSKFQGVPLVLGPFSVFDTRAFLTQPVLNFTALAHAREAAESVRAAEYSYKEARELVVLAVANAYLLTLADHARVDAAEAQLKTAESLYEQARDMHQAGLTASIDELRAHVEQQTRQQQLLAAQNQYDTQKLVLARAIGLPLGQAFELTSQVPYAPLVPGSLAEALASGLAHRADYLGAQASLRAAEQARAAAGRERWPSLALTANYGDIGIAPGISHGTVTMTGNLTIPIFQGGRVRGNVLQADAALRRRQEELDNLRGRIDQEIRTAFLDLTSTASQVQVAESSVALARDTLTQAQDRFKAGVVDNLEVVQAQETLATANEARIQSLYAYNLAKANLARAMGIIETSALEYLGGK